MMALIWSALVWAIFGLVVGAIARLLYPGRQAMTMTMTMVLGIVGSVLGGVISWMVSHEPGEGPFSGAGWIMSIVGAMIVVWLSLFLSSRSKTGANRRTM
jgi:uncharacterized membrane protein YeaQ/YmgE (transglycosylase-associated protein family)